MSTKHFALAVFLGAAAAASPVASADDLDPAAGALGRETGIGMGLGGFAGAVLAGPAGLILGAAGGALIGHDRAASRRVGELEDELAQAHDGLADLPGGDSEPERIRLAALTEIRAAPPAGLAYARNLAGGLSFLVQFRHDSHRVAPHFAEQLRGLARVLEPVSGLHVQVDGFADQRGGTPYNEALSFHRARAVADVMREAGWSAERIHVRAHGEGRPLVPEGDYAGYPFDRRALITFTAGGTGR